MTYNSNVDFEVDSKIVADYFNRGGGDVTEFGLIMDSSIQFCSFIYKTLMFSLCLVYNK